MNELPPNIDSLPTSVAAFVGTFESGPINQAVSVASAREFQENFGDPSYQSAVSVTHFFLNGGNKCWAIRADPEAEMLPALQRSIQALEDVQDFNLLCLPAAGVIDQQLLVEVIGEALSLCERRRAFLLIDSPSACKAPHDVLMWLDSNPAIRHRNAALYFPWLKVTDSAGSSVVRVPPSGAVAGVMARIDATRGVWKAPAGTEASLKGVDSLDTALSDQENRSLNQNGVNCLRQFPEQAAVVWGARTISSDPEWRYVNVRRLALFLEDSIDRGLQWIKFEPNNEQLWSVLQQTVARFLQPLFIAGAFLGNRAEQAYFVRCDRTTMTQNDIDNGRCIALVGFAPVKPAEFINLRITRSTLL